MRKLRLCVTMCGLFLLSPVLWAQYTLEYSTNESGITLTNFSGTPVDVTVPSFVTTIGDNAFYECYSLTSVTIPQSVAVIGDSAFYGCTNLATVTISNGVATIEGSAFTGCANLTSIAIPASVTNIGYAAFSPCASLAAITVDTNNPAYTSVLGVLFDIGQDTLIQYPPASAAPAYTIPGTVTNIGSYAFQLCANLTNVTISDSVTSIENGAFTACGRLASITIPSNVTSIGNGAFSECQSLEAAYFQGNAPTGNSSVFSSDSGTVYYPCGATGWLPSFGGLETVALGSCNQTGSLQVNITPAGATNAGAQWQVNGGFFQNSGAIVPNLAAGTYLVSFGPALGWTPPSNLFVTITNGETNIANGNYEASSAPTNGLVLVTNGKGTIQHGAWPRSLTPGKAYTVKAAPRARNLFVNWVGGSNLPYSLLTTNASCSFNYEPGLVLEANFVTNLFYITGGAYYGLFGPGITNRDQTNSGSFSFSLTAAGVVSGKLNLGSQSVVLSGKFAADGSADLRSKRHEANALTTSLLLDAPNQAVNGTVTDGSFVAQLTGFQDVFNSHRKATAYEGKYTLMIPGTTNPALGPYGTSYGTATVGGMGAISFAGALADGTAVSQSSVVSQDGWWPMYINLYGGKGSLWGWNCFTNGGLATNSTVSWINGGNSSRTAALTSGFTNEAAALIGFPYSPTNEPLFGFTNGEVVLDLLSSSAFSNGVTIAANNKIETNSTGEISKLKLTVNKTNGVISGSFANPSNPKQTIKVNGAILQGQTNAQGYFIHSNQSGVFLLAPQ
jgi:hypothetical protein